MIGVDTYSWRKIIRFLNSDWKVAFEDIINQINLFITVEGKKEFEYRFPDHLYLLDKIIILPLLNTNQFSEYFMNFDSNDSSLLEYAKHNSHRLITEDYPMLEQAITDKLNAVQLIDFLFELYINYNFFTDTEMKRLIRTLREWRNIKKKKAEYYQDIIDTR